jgi:hypothetical protein
MMKPKVDDVTLLRYFEDDLTSEERTVVKALIDDDSSAQARLQMLEATAQTLRNSFDGFDREADVDKIGAPVTGTVSKAQPPEEAHPASDRRAGNGAARRAGLRWTRLFRDRRNISPIHRHTAARPVVRNRATVLAWGGAIAAQLAVIAILAGIYWSPLSPMSDDQQSVAELVPPETIVPDSEQPRTIGPTFARQSEVATKMVSLPVDDQKLLNALERLPNDWKREVFDSTIGSTKILSFGEGQEATFRLEGSVPLSDNFECRMATFAVAGIEGAAQRLLACAPQSGDWALATVELLINIEQVR